MNDLTTDIYFDLQATWVIGVLGLFIVLLELLHKVEQSVADDYLFLNKNHAYIYVYNIFFSLCVMLLKLTTLTV